MMCESVVRRYFDRHIDTYQRLLTDVYLKPSDRKKYVWDKLLKIPASYALSIISNTLQYFTVGYLIYKGAEKDTWEFVVDTGRRQGWIKLTEDDKKY